MMYHLLMHRCDICKDEFPFRVRFNRHIIDVHGLTFQSYVLQTQHNGIVPLCECGCGELVKFGKKSFNKLIHGHYTQELRDDQSRRRSSTTASDETRKRQSLSLKQFYSSEEGKQKAEARAVKLREFHASDAGEAWVRNRSLLMKEFNQTQEGKILRILAGRKVSEWNSAHPELVLQKAAKVKASWTPEKSEKQRARLREFYQTGGGREKIKQAMQKARVKLLSTRDEFDAKITRALSEHESFTSVPKFEDYDGIKTFLVDLNIRCKNGHEYTRKLINLINIPHCLLCTGFNSRPQNEVANFVKSLGVDVIENDRTIINPLEIDVYVPTHKFGIEFNGLYWHSESSCHKTYHVELKHEKLQEKGVNLMTIFEDEWRDRRDIIKSMIRHRLGLTELKLYARKLQLKEANYEERKKFFSESHLESDVKSKIAFGLHDGHEFVSMLSIRKPFHNSNSDYVEIARFATKPDVMVVGGLAKLIAHTTKWTAENKFKGIMTYVDTRVGEGNGYAKVGFNHVKKTGLRFWWTDFHNRFNRFQYRATKELTESEVAKRAGVVKIWGAANNLYVLEI